MMRTKTRKSFVLRNYIAFPMAQESQGAKTRWAGQLDRIKGVEVILKCKSTGKDHQV